jgi:hypothetical protein
LSEEESHIKNKSKNERKKILKIYKYGEKNEKLQCN